MTELPHAPHNDVQSLEFIERWPLFSFKKKAHAQYLARMYRSLGAECERLLDEIERLQPPIDTTGIIPVADHVRALREKDLELSELRAAYGSICKQLGNKR